jgi:MraZ protein
MGAAAVFRGFSSVSIDAKGRMAVPARHRELLDARGVNTLIMTLSPWDSCLWAYPLPAWDDIDDKLNALPAADAESRMAKRVMLGHATDCVLDAQGRVLVPQELRDLAGIARRAVVLGQGNKFEVWDEGAWGRRREEWLQTVAAGGNPSSAMLASLAL